MAGLIGNVLEWFDFAVYGYFASDIGQQFFPQSSPTAQQLLAFAVFALGFLRAAVRQPRARRGRRPHRTARAADGVDRADGRRDAADRAAADLRADRRRRANAAGVLRIVQGFSLGGEFTGSMVYTTEQASPAMARPDQQLDRCRHHAGLHPRVRIGVAGQPLAGRRTGVRVGLAHSVHRQRQLVRHRMAAAPRHPRVGRRA